MKHFLSIVVVFVLAFFIVPFTANAVEYIRVIGDYVSIWNTASSSKRLARVLYGTEMQVLGESGNYYKVIYDGVNTGYISKTYVLKDSEVKAQDAAYSEVLKAAGFTDSTYWPYLTYLHQKHPNWTFEALQTGLDFYEVVDAQVGQNVIQYSSSSDSDLFFDAYTNSDELYEAGGWYEANYDVVAYVMDPRNFLIEKSIFMFEELQFNSANQTYDSVSTILGSSSYLNTTLDQKKYSYIDYFLDAGKTYNVSANHLAARVRQEGGADADYGPITGTSTKTYNGKSLKGYYNYYNIQAYGSNPQVNALAYAAGYIGGDGTSYGRPWDSRRKAIYGGAQFIAKSYISAGQYTLYLQKFQVNKNADYSINTHQYMTNIFAPYQEGYNVKDSYEELGILDETYNFVIPVFENMPVKTTMPLLLSTNNSVTGIYINGSLISNFDSDITEYVYYVTDDTTIANVSVTQSSSSKVEGTGDYELTDTSTTVTVTVTADSGAIKEYVITITKVKDTTTIENIIDNLGVKVNGGYLYGISTNLATSTIISSVQKLSPTATVRVTDASGNEKSDGVIATGDKLILSTAVSGSATYTLCVNGDLNGDGGVDIRDLLRIQKHLLETSKLSGEYSLAADTNGDGKISSQDLLRIQKHILGSIVL